ncbi:MAG: rubrerythrin family protein [Anaerolineales bacterium]|nr:rubrerythrin family protein [Anaerolineales bacterium]
MSKSLDDLQSAFAGESQANRRYLAFAEKADAEGHPQVARLFRAAAQAETVHAHNHLRAMDGIKSTSENLQVAIQGENYEHTTMYPAFIKDADAEGNKRATRSFNYAMQVEVEHEGFYRQALESLGKDKEQYDYYVCPVCGHTHARFAPDKCPICGAPKDRFIRVS